MTYKEVFQMLNSITLTESTATIPCAYFMFPEDDVSNPAPPPPFLVYYYDGSDDLMADDTNYQKIRPLTIELYTDNKDFSLEETVETALKNGGLSFSRSEEYIDTERLYMVTYEAEIVITEELPNG